MAGCLLCSSLLLLLRSSLSSIAHANLTALTSAYTSTYTLPTTLTSSSPNPRRVRIMTYNVKQIPNYLGFHAWDQKKRLDKFVEAFEVFALSSTASSASNSASGPNSASGFNAATGTTKLHPDTPDAIVLNELISGTSYDTIRRRLSHIFPYATNVIGKDCATEEGWTSLTGNCQVFLPRGGVAIISRHPIEEAHGLVYDAKAKGTWDQLCNKGAVLAKIILPDDYDDHDDATTVNNATADHAATPILENAGATTPDSKVAAGEVGSSDVSSTPPRVRAVWVMGTHLQADEGAKMGGGTREKQAVEFTKWIDEGVGNGLFDIDAQREPLIIAGDLNVRFKGKQQDYQKMMELTKLSVNLTMEDARRGVGSFSALSNWLAKADYFSHSMPLDYDDILDYIGFRRDFRRPVFAPAQRVLPLKAKQAWYWGYMKGWWNLPGKGWTWNNGYYNDVSDHYPAMADFYF